MPFLAILPALFILAPAHDIPAPLRAAHAALNGPAGEVAAVTMLTLGIAAVAARLMFPGRA